MNRTFAELQNDAVFFLGPKSKTKLKNEDAIKPDQRVDRQFSGCDVQFFSGRPVI